MTELTSVGTMETIPGPVIRVARRFVRIKCQNVRIKCQASIISFIRPLGQDLWELLGSPIHFPNHTVMSYNDTITSRIRCQGDWHVTRRQGTVRPL